MFSIYFYILGWVSLTARVSYILFFQDLFIFEAVPGLRCCVWAFLGAESGGCSHCGARAFRRSGFCCCGARILSAWASVVVW